MSCCLQRYILMEARLSQLYPKHGTPGYKGGEFEVLRKFPGAQLKGVRYTPLFEYFKSYADRGAFQVLVDTYVTNDAGAWVRCCRARAVLLLRAALLFPGYDGTGVLVDVVLSESLFFSRD